MSNLAGLPPLGQKQPSVSRPAVRPSAAMSARSAPPAAQPSYGKGAPRTRLQTGASSAALRPVEVHHEEKPERLPPSYPLRPAPRALSSAQIPLGPSAPSTRPRRQLRRCWRTTPHWRNVQLQHERTDHDPHILSAALLATPSPGGPVIVTEEPPIADVRPRGDDGGGVVS